jgi:hypothetical protein
MICITGDTHGTIDISKLNHVASALRKVDDENHYMIIAGDFGMIWQQSYSDSQINTKDMIAIRRVYEKKPWITLFVDGNHENYSRLCTEEYVKYMRGEDITGADQGEFPLVDMFGGKVQKIRDGVYHLLRGEIYTIHGKKILAFGGASSHDISDGILDRANFASDDEFYETVYLWRKTRRMWRIKDVSWWPQEIPNEDEMRHCMENLAKHDFKVDYIVTHCAPEMMHRLMGYDEPDACNKFLQQVAEKTTFSKWFFGHYHQDAQLNEQYYVLYHNIYLAHDANVQERWSCFEREDSEA